MRGRPMHRPALRVRTGSGVEQDHAGVTPVVQNEIARWKPKHLANAIGYADGIFQ